MIVLAFANVLDDVNVAENLHASDWLANANANVTGERVVSDQGIITTGWGYGLGHGPDDAPNEEFCLKIQEEIDFQISNSANFPSVVFLSTIIGLSLVSIIVRMVKFVKLSRK